MRVDGGAHNAAEAWPNRPANVPTITAEDIARTAVALATCPRYPSVSDAGDDAPWKTILNMSMWAAVIRAAPGTIPKRRHALEPTSPCA